MKITISDKNFKVSVYKDCDTINEILRDLVIPAIVSLGYEPDEILDHVNSIINIDEKPSCFFN
jgi:hypothetical protein